MAVSVTSSTALGKFLSHMIVRCRCRHVVETGTHDGLGSSLVIARALAAVPLRGAEQVRYDGIEISSTLAAQALGVVRGVLGSLHDADVGSVAVHCGSSVSRDVCDRARIEIEGVLRNAHQSAKLAGRSIAMDYSVDPVEASSRYQIESRLEPGALTSRLEWLLDMLASFYRAPDLVLLDGAGHQGYDEFKVFSSSCVRRCILVLDDTDHVKHFRSVERAKRDRRFSMLWSTPERFGSVAFAFSPDAESTTADANAEAAWSEMLEDAVGEFEG